MRTFEEIKSTIETGLGKHPCDLKIENVQLVNVYSGEIYPTNIYIKGERIISIDPDAELEAHNVMDGNGEYAIPGFIDSPLKRGALAFSTSHDHHNIVVVGCNDEDMAVAVNELVRIHGGGAVACDGKVMDSMPLILGGLMSDQPAEIVMKEINRLNQSARSLGNQMDAPFMALSFISLPTVPELGLTDMGLIDVLNHKIIPLIIEE